ncbi:MAG: WecB/TagA/CpsF family glycosyltransferase [Candidatus Komeilibacteria bacterium]
MKNNLTLLGTNISLALTKDFDQRIAELLNGNGCQQIVTINPEFLVQAYNDPAYRLILNQAEAATIDGFGLIFMSFLTGQYGQGIRRITGVELTERLLARAQADNLRVAIILPDNPLARRSVINEALRQRYPQLSVVVYYEQELAISDPIVADVTFVTFGSPRQDIWIAEEKMRHLIKAKVAVGVGGTFDFISGKIQRAPSWLRGLGLEWLWRLFLQPKRWRRIINAVIVFPWLVFSVRSKQ